MKLAVGALVVAAALTCVPSALAVAPPTAAAYAVRLTVIGAKGTPSYPAGTVNFHRLGLDFNVPLKPHQTVNEALVPGNYTVTTTAPGAVCATTHLKVTLTTRLTSYPVTCHSIPACTAAALGERCTRLGILGPWQSAKLADDGMTLIVLFTGHCGDDPTDPYRAHVTFSGDHVSVGIYGSRPFSNLCAAGRTLNVYLTSPLGSRVLLDAYSGKPTQTH